MVCIDGCCARRPSNWRTELATTDCRTFKIGFRGSLCLVPRDGLLGAARLAPGGRSLGVIRLLRLVQNGTANGKAIGFSVGSRGTDSNRPTNGPTNRLSESFPGYAIEPTVLPERSRKLSGRRSAKR